MPRVSPQLSCRCTCQLQKRCCTIIHAYNHTNFSCCLNFRTTTQVIFVPRPAKHNASQQRHTQTGRRSLTCPSPFTLHPKYRFIMCFVNKKIESFQHLFCGFSKTCMSQMLLVITNARFRECVHPNFHLHCIIIIIIAILFALMGACMTAVLSIVLHTV